MRTIWEEEAEHWLHEFQKMEHLGQYHQDFKWLFDQTGVHLYLKQSFLLLLEGCVRNKYIFWIYTSTKERKKKISIVH